MLKCFTDMFVFLCTVLHVTTFNVERNV